MQALSLHARSVLASTRFAFVRDSLAEAIQVKAPLGSLVYIASHLFQLLLTARRPFKECR